MANRPPLLLKHILQWFRLSPALLLIFCFISSSAVASASGVRVIADLYREWGIAIPKKTQPLGGWELLRGKKGSDLNALVALNRFEDGVGGTAGRSIWGYGSSIFQQPCFERTVADGAPVIIVVPQKDDPRNNGMGSAYIKWVSPVSGSIQFVFALRNMGADVQGNFGMSVGVRQYRLGSDTSYGNVSILSVPGSRHSSQWEHTTINARAVEGQVFLIEISPDVDSYGNRLAFTVQVQMQ